MPKIITLLPLIVSCLFTIHASNSNMQANFIDEIINYTPSSSLFDFNISPNPAKDNIKIEFSENISGIIFIHDNLGNQVLELGINSSSNQDISLANISSGIYFISVKTNTKTVIKRLIKY